MRLLPHNRRFRVTRNIKSAFRSIFQNGARFAWTMEFMLDARQKVITGNGVMTSPGQWERLSQLDRAECFGYWEALADAHLAALSFRYLIDGKWYTPSEVCDRKDGTDPARDIPSPCTNGHYVYTVNTENGPEYRIYF